MLGFAVDRREITTEQWGSLCHEPRNEDAPAVADAERIQPLRRSGSRISSHSFFMLSTDNSAPSRSLKADWDYSSGPKRNVDSRAATTASDSRK